MKIIYACESGSRAWDFASKDSDYDVRFIYAHPVDWYMSIANRKDVIEIPVDQELDISGWDIRKSLYMPSPKTSCMSSSVKQRSELSGFIASFSIMRRS